MIKFNTSKEKTLKFDITVEGISPSVLTYTLRLSENNVDYGFPGKIKNGEVVVTIPPLNTIMKQDRINELKKVKLEIHDAGKSYYMKPFEDTILIEKEPTLELKIKEDNDIVTESLTVKVKDDTDVVVEKKACDKKDGTGDREGDKDGTGPGKKKKKTKLSKFFGDK